MGQLILWWECGILLSAALGFFVFQMGYLCRHWHDPYMYGPIPPPSTDQTSKIDHL